MAETSDDFAESAQASPMSSHAAHRSNQELLEMMRRRRDLCAEFESSPGGTAMIAADASAAPSSEGASKSELWVSDSRRASSRTSAKELESWMARMRGRCLVLESTPAPAVADVLWSDGSAAVGPGLVLESIPTACAADACAGVALAEGVVGPARVARAMDQAPESHSAGSAGTHVQDAWGARVRGGWPLPSGSRLQVWSQHLQVKKLQPGQDTEDHCSLIAVPLLALLLKAGAAAAGDAKAGVMGEACVPLAAAFSERHLCSLAAQNLWGMLVRLLWYHCPRIAANLAKLCNAADMDLASALDMACGGPGGLAQLLLTPGASAHGKEGILLLCDRLVVEARDMLLLLVVVALVVEASDAIELPGSIENAMEWIRDNALRSLGTRGIQGVRHCLDSACALYESTPLSFFSLLALGGSSSACSDLPVCTIASHEVLTHIFETPASAWRLVVVDVRREVDGFALPVCMRLSEAQDRRAILEELPDKDTIHVCLLGDGPPVPGEEAFELWQFLTRAPTFRKHLSVAAKGWPEVAELAHALGLELFPLDLEEAESKLEGNPSVGQQARAAVAAVTETATAAGIGAARRMLAGLGFTQSTSETALSPQAV